MTTFFSLAKMFSLMLIFVWLRVLVYITLRMLVLNMGGDTYSMKWPSNGDADSKLASGSDFSAIPYW